jgi:hypothetical protein
MTKEDTRFNAIGICPGDGRTRLKGTLLSVGLQGSCVLFCILTPNYDRLAHRRLFSLTRLLFSYLSLMGALFSLLRIHLCILGSLSLGNYRSRAL